MEHKLGLSQTHGSRVRGLFQPITRRINDDCRVSEFILLSGTWDAGKLQWVFLPIDVDIILSIPLAKREAKDGWCWHYDIDGIYTVKSGYSLAWSLQVEEGVADSSRLGLAIPVVNQATRWMKPPPESFALAMDASVIPEKGFVRLERVIRDAKVWFGWRGHQVCLVISLLMWWSCLQFFWD
uniref:Uncharacterized protein n=1 Tax=Cannabis sativa TaxID=3483 RepID=A0A803P1Q0_CANSA